MSSDGLPEDLGQFILAYIQSVAQLELVLLMHQQRGTEWSPAALAKELRNSPEAVTAYLEDLESRGLLQFEAGENERYELKPEASVSQTLERLVEYYASHRYRVIDTIYSKRADDLHAFAKAFVIKGKER